MRVRDKGAIGGATAGVGFGLIEGGAIGVAALGGAVGVPLLLAGVVVGAGLGYGVGAAIDVCTKDESKKKKTKKGI